MDFDVASVAHFGDIFAESEKNNMRIGDRDMMIAGHARSLGCTLITNNLALWGIGLFGMDLIRDSIPAPGWVSYGEGVLIWER